MGLLEIQILCDDLPARLALDLEDPADGPATCRTDIRCAASVAEALPAIAGLRPLMISIDHLSSLKTASALAEEYFTVELRRLVPVHRPDERIADGPQRFDIIELTCGETEFSAMVPQDSAWPHVTVHRVYPSGAELTPLRERAFLAALRDAVDSLRVPPRQ